jgi:hypothetical protein
MGVRHALFPTPALGAPSRGCRFPDAILHGKRSSRPRGRAVQRLAAAEFRVRLFSPLRLVVAPLACEPGQDTPAILFRLLTAGTGSAAALDGAFARRHGSRLFSHRSLFSQPGGVVFNIADARKVFTRLARPSCPSRCGCSFCPTFRRLFLADPVLRDRQSHPSVLIHSSNQCLLATAIRPGSKLA